MNSDTRSAQLAYQNPSFPFVMFTINQQQCIPPGPGYHYLHWHEDLQFTIVTKGTVSMMVNGAAYELHATDAIFINSSLLHMTNRISDDGEYVSFNFPARLISVLHGSTMETDFVQKYTMNYHLPAITLHTAVAWQSQLIRQLLDLITFCGERAVYAKEYEISLRLQAIWLLLIRNVREDLRPASPRYARKQESMQRMLSFLHTQFGQDISLSDIAQAAHISQSECSRIFKAMLGTSPYEYLTCYRVNKAMDLLHETDLPVSAIAAAVGFHDSSHFIQQFRRHTGDTPQRHRNGAHR